MKPLNVTSRFTLQIVTILMGAVVFVLLTGCAGETAKPAQAAAVDNYVHGVLAYKNGDRDQAIKDLQLAVEERPDLVMAHDLLGDVYQSRREYRNALTQYRATTKLDPYFFKNYYKQGLTLQLLNRVKEAIAAYLQALNLEPNDAMTNQNLGVAYMSLDDLANAIKYCRRAVELDPKAAPGWSNLAVALDTSRLYEDAEKAYRTAMELDSARLEIPEALAMNLVHQNRLEEAQSVMDQVVRLGNTAAHRKRLGDILSMRKKYAEAVGEYGRALDLDPRYYPALNETGRALVAQFNQSLELDDEKRLAAVEAWNKSLRIKPDQPRVAELLKSYAQRRQDMLH